MSLQLTARVTGGWGGSVDSPSKREKLEARNMLKKRGAYPKSGAPIVRRHFWEHVNVFVPYLANTEHDKLWTADELCPKVALFNSSSNRWVGSLQKHLTSP